MSHPEIAWSALRSADAALQDDLQFLARWEREPTASPAAMLRMRQLRRAQQGDAEPAKFKPTAEF